MWKSQDGIVYKTVKIFITSYFTSKLKEKCVSRERFIAILQVASHLILIIVMLKQKYKINQNQILYIVEQIVK